MFHRITNDVMPPALIASMTTFLSWAADAPWLGILGLIVSAGWLALGWAKHTGWGADRFSHRPASPVPPASPAATEAR